MHIFEHKLSIEEKDPCVHAAEMFVVKTKVIAFSSAETVEAAAILQCYGELASPARDHVSHLQAEHAIGAVHMHSLNEKASHLHQSALVQYLRMSDLDKGSSLSATVSEIKSSLTS